MNDKIKFAERNGLAVPEQYGAPKSIVIAWASGGHPEGEFYESLIKFFAQDAQQRRLWRGMLAQRSVYVDNNRNSCVKQFLEGGIGDVLLFVDQDHRFTIEQVYALMDSVDVEHQVVGGLYFNYAERDGKLYPVWLERSDNGLRSLSRIAPNEIREVAAVGAGFMAITRNVLIQIQAKYADDPWHWFGRDIHFGEHVGEDVCFCLRATECGYKVWGNSHVIVDHRKGKWLNWTDFQRDWLLTENRS